MQFEVTRRDTTIELELNEEASVARINGDEIAYSLIIQQNGRVLYRSGTKLWKVDNISVEKQKVTFSVDGHFVETYVKDEQELLLEKLGFQTDSTARAGLLSAPMPGKILELLVHEGDSVEEGQPVIILEAMKMENELKAPASGSVTSIHAADGDSVEKNQPLLEIEPRG